MIDRLMRGILLCEPLVAAALVLPFKFSSTESRMAEVVDEAVRLTAEECGDAGLLFTDGALDAAVEVAAARRGRKLKALSMMAASEPYDIAIRVRDETDEEDRATLSVGTADALRTWVRAKPSRAANIAVQLGFELWKHDKLPIPKSAGMVARTAGFPPGAAESGIAAARVLSDKILAIYAKANPAKEADPWLNAAFTFVQWRIARMCRMRADEADRAGNVQLALSENALADKLDGKNPAYMRIRKSMDWVGRQKGVRMTAREGLRLGLDRADFRLARTFAQQVLASDPYDTRANFAMGMGYFTEELYGRAEFYLKRCLQRSPNEPAVLNNLAIVQLRLGRLEEAETNALRALKSLPESQEIKKTFSHIRIAKEQNL